MNHKYQSRETVETPSLSQGHTFKCKTSGNSLSVGHLWSLYALTLHTSSCSASSLYEPLLCHLHLDAEELRHSAPHFTMASTHPFLSFCFITAKSMQCQSTGAAIFLYRCSSFETMCCIWLLRLTAENSYFYSSLIELIQFAGTSNTVIDHFLYSENHSGIENHIGIAHWRSL